MKKTNTDFWIRHVLFNWNCSASYVIHFGFSPKVLNNTCQLTADSYSYSHYTAIKWIFIA